MYGYQITLEHPGSRNKRSVLQILSRQRHSSVIQLLRAEGMYQEYKDWNLVDFQIACKSDPEPQLKRVIDALPQPGAIIQLVA